MSSRLTDVASMRLSGGSSDARSRAWRRCAAESLDRESGARSAATESSTGQLPSTCLGVWSVTAGRGPRFAVSPRDPICEPEIFRRLSSNGPGAAPHHPRIVTPDAGPPTKGECHDFPRSSAATEASVSFFKKIEG